MLAQQPGWKDYVWWRVNRLAKDPDIGAMFADLPAQLTVAMLSKQQSKPTHTPTASAQRTI